ELIDPVQADDETLGRCLEASDLSPHPGLALERVLEEPAAASRDVVLLTHPRNLLEEDVRAAALRATRQTRLLALALDGHGSATLEILPRPLTRGQPPGHVETIIGVAGGFVVVGRNYKDQALRQEVTVAHYDLGKRACAVRTFRAETEPIRWYYSAAHHTV